MIFNTATNAPTIAILDSGAGGLSIAKELSVRRIQARLVYIADKHYFPYGKLDDDTLKDRVIALVQAIQRNFSIDIFIIACNTASTLVLPDLRCRWDTPFIGVVPAIKPASEQTHSQSIAVLATSATVQRAYLFELVERFASTKKVKMSGSSELVEIAEAFIDNESLSTEMLATLRAEIENAVSTTPSKGEKIDQLVLACTHFPILKPEIEKVLKANKTKVNIIDSSPAIANRLECILKAQNRLSDTSKPDQGMSIADPNTATFITSGSERLTQYARYLFGDGAASAHFLEEFK